MVGVLGNEKSSENLGCITTLMIVNILNFFSLNKTPSLDTRIWFLEKCGVDEGYEVVKEE